MFHVLGVDDTKVGGKELPTRVYPKGGCFQGFANEIGRATKKVLKTQVNSSEPQALTFFQGH